eukprot:scaffold6652_cov113-Cylindrotheca_fusiformis.AAC.2
MNSENIEPLSCSTSNMYERTEISVQSTMIPEPDLGPLLGSSFLAHAVTSFYDVLCVAIELMEHQDGSAQDDEEEIVGT